MKKIILAVFGLVVGTGAGTGFSALTAGAAATEDPADADRRPVQAAMPAVTQPMPTPTAGGAAPAEGTESHAVEPTPEPRRTESTSSPEEGHSSEGAELIGRIVAVMEPSAAAAVLEELDSHEIEAILRTVPMEKLARILSAMTPVKAAALSRTLLEQTR